MPGAPALHRERGIRDFTSGGTDGREGKLDGGTPLGGIPTGGPLIGGAGKFGGTRTACGGWTSGHPRRRAPTVCMPIPQQQVNDSSTAAVPPTSIMRKRWAPWRFAAY